MGYYIQIGLVPMQPIASNRGWSDVKRWISHLPPKYNSLHHFALYAWDQELERMTQNLKDALASHPPTELGVQPTVENWLALMEKYGKGAIVATLTDGMTPTIEAEDENPEEDEASD